MAAMTPDARRREAIAADCQRASEWDILRHTIPQAALVVGIDWASSSDITAHTCCTSCGCYVDGTTARCESCAGADFYARER